MIRVFLVPNELLTPLDPRAHNFSVNVKMSVHYRGQKFYENYHDS